MALLARLTGNGRLRASKNDALPQRPQEIDLNIFDSPDENEYDLTSSERGIVESKEEYVKPRTEVESCLPGRESTREDVGVRLSQDKPTIVVSAVVVPSRAESAEFKKQQEERLARYEREISDTRASIVSQREMWEKLVKDSEAQVRDLREELNSTREERDSIRAKVLRATLERRQRTEELTEYLVRQKMRAAELSSEIDIYKHHALLVQRRRDEQQRRQMTWVDSFITQSH